MSSGIYQIRNTVNGKLYVGSAVSLKKRLGQHLRHLKGKYHTNLKLQHAWDKYGSESFVFEVLEEVADVNDLLTREQFWIDTKNAVTAGYNITPTAGSVLGTKFSDETRQRMSAAAKGKKKSPEHVEKVRQSLLGRKMTEEQVEKMRVARTGKKTGRRAPEVGQRISAALKGNPLSKEHKEKLSVAKLGIKWAPEVLKQRGEAISRAYWERKRLSDTATNPPA